MTTSIPNEIHGQKYICLTTFRKSGAGISTPVWFGEDNGKLYVMTRSDSGKYKRLRNNPQAQVSPCTMRGKIKGPQFPATVRILTAQEWPHAKQTIHRKHWLARVPFLWSKNNVYLEIVARDNQTF
jgi:PPOX class probable F420-dependent enzyme